MEQVERAESGGPDDVGMGLKPMPDIIEKMKKPTVRVTKWLSDIPVEATCSACPGVSFRAQCSSHRPKREEYQKSPQTQFDAHFKAEHSSSMSP
jgi:hypothetical protein